MYSVLDFVYCNPNIKGKQQKKEEINFSYH